MIIIIMRKIIIIKYKRSQKKDVSRIHKINSEQADLYGEKYKQNKNPKFDRARADKFAFWTI